MEELTVTDLGTVDYDRALRLQKELLGRIQRGESTEAYLLLAEHDPPVITSGRRGRDEDILATADELAAEGITLRHVSRGGAVTYHGPGQLVAYPILSLRRPRRKIRQYVDCLVAALAAVLERFGISADETDGRTGVWAGGAKIASVGVAVERGVCYHGVALNVCTNLDHFSLIVPCGADTPVTSISAVLGRHVDTAEVAAPLAECIADALGMRFERGAPDKPAPLGALFPCPAAWAKVKNRTSKQRLVRGTRPVGTGPRRLPEWLKRPIPPAGASARVREVLQRHRLATVCQGAHCPNRPECFGRGVATFMILGDRCTRNCRFCAVETDTPLPVRPDEPQAVAAAAAELGLTHVVITSVTRDDLSDGGAGQFARTIRHVRRRLPGATIEVLTPDFQGDHAAIDRVCAAGPDVFNHNVETVPRLYPDVRPQARYRRSLDVLAWARRIVRDEDWPVLTKSGLMVGLGETGREVRAVMRDLRGAEVSLLTIGQYLQPSDRHIGVREFIPPERFDAWRDFGLGIGFTAVAAAPHVRSSYNAESILPPR